MRKSHIAHLSAILAAGAISLPLLASTTSAFAATSESTTVTLSAVTSSVTYGSEGAETFSATVTGQSGDGYPEGTVDFNYGLGPTTMCSSSTSTATTSDTATYSCSLAATQLAPTTYSEVDAVYTPGSPSSSNTGYTYTTSTSTPTQSFTVNAAPAESTTVTLSAVTSPVTYGSEGAETFSATVTGQSGDGYPEGTVDFNYGLGPTTVCSSSTSTATTSDTATYSCSLAATQLAPTTYSDVDAVYTPGSPSSSNTGYTYTTSTSTPTQSFTVNAASTESTTTGLGLSLTSVAYGAETSEIFTVSVTGLSGDGYPEGTVAVYNSTTELCGATLTPVSSYSSSATCSLTAYQLTAGAYDDVFATYTPAIPSSNLSYTYVTSSLLPGPGLLGRLGEYHDRSRAVFDLGGLRC